MATRRVDEFDRVASYGVRLFHRSRRDFSLTEFGEALLPMTEDAELKIIAARKRVEGLGRSASGKIRFSLTPTLAYDIVAPLIARFSDQYPEIDIEVRLTSEVESITNDETGISLRAASEVTDDVVARKLFQLEIGVYVGKGYLASVVPNAGPDGSGLTWIGLPSIDRTHGGLSHFPFQNAAIRHEVSDGHMHAQLVNLNAGNVGSVSIFYRLLQELSISISFYSEFYGNRVQTCGAKPRIPAVPQFRLGYVQSCRI